MFTPRVSRSLRLGPPVILAILVVLAITAPTMAQNWPSRTVKVVVPFGAGGITDSTVRLLANRLSVKFNQTFVVENHPGAGGSVGAEYAARSKPDGYTLLFTSAPQYSALPLMQSLRYDPAKDFIPVSIVSDNALLLTVPANSPLHSIDEFVDYVKARPGRIYYSTGGFGTATHLAPAAFAKRVGLDMVAVPSDSGPAALHDLLGGSTQFYMGQPSDVYPSIEAGKLRLIATTGEHRSSRFPNMPTLSERYPGFVMIMWSGCFVPTGTPEGIVDRLSSALAEIVHEPDIVRKFDLFGVEPTGTSQTETLRIIRSSAATFADAVKSAGLEKTR